jgi:hypothetical protein
MGTSVEMIDRHYGHLLADADEYLMRAFEAFDGRDERILDAEGGRGMRHELPRQPVQEAEALCRTRTDDPLLTILGQRREARAQEGHRGHESAANRTSPTPTNDPRVDARGRAGVRTTFARAVGLAANDSALTP